MHLLPTVLGFTAKNALPALLLDILLVLVNIGALECFFILSLVNDITGTVNLYIR